MDKGTGGQTRIGLGCLDTLVIRKLSASWRYSYTTYSSGDETIAEDVSSPYSLEVSIDDVR